jgi:molecular chaperone DnaK (HSP70)
MAESASNAGPEPGSRVTIGITFGNSNSSIAYTTDSKAEVIADESGGMYLIALGRTREHHHS